MNKLVKTVDGQVVVSSKDVADKFNKVHRDVLRAIKQMDCSEDFRVRNFAQSTFTSSQNKVIQCFDMTRDGFSFLCMGFTGGESAKWKEAYITAFNKLERSLSLETPKTMEALNHLTKKIEGDKELASKCGTLLSAYRKVKKDNQEDWVKGVRKVQMQLGFQSGGEA